jgi:hypothetical protein
MLKGIGRIIVVIGAFVIAALAALALGIRLGLERFTHATHGSDDAWLTLVGILWQGAQVSFAMTLAIAVLMVVIGEVARIRTPLFYIAGGGLAVAATPLLIGLGDRASATPPAVLWQVFATAGFVGGAIYWAIAGRRA